MERRNDGREADTAVADTAGDRRPDAAILALARLIGRRIARETYGEAPPAPPAEKRR